MNMNKKITLHHSAGGLVVSPSGKIALTQYTSGEWTIPKGHLEKKELPWQAALREAKEELSLSSALVKTYLCSKKYSFTLEENGPLHIKKVDYYLIETTETQIKLKRIHHFFIVHLHLLFCSIIVALLPATSQGQKSYARSAREIKI